jgi:adenylate kinase family enzyme
VDTPERIAILGCIGAGKSALGRELGDRLGLPVIHLDKLWWTDGNYVITGRATAQEHALAPAAFRDLQDNVTKQARWIIDGDTSSLDVRLRRADTVILLDLPRWICAWRVLRRTGAKRDDYPPNVRESWRWTVTLLDWILRKYPSRRRHILAAISEHAAHADVVVLTSRQAVRDYVSR